MVNTLNPPLSVISTWPEPDYHTRDHSGPEFEIIIIILTFFAAIVVGARVYTRIYITKTFGIDDALIVVGAILTFVITALVSLGYFKFYVGYHVWDVPVWARVSGTRMGFFLLFAYLFASCFVRMSILLFHRRLNVSFTQMFIIAVWVGIIVNIGETLGLAIYMLALCRPLNFYWNQVDPEWFQSHLGQGSCLEHRAYLVAHGIFSVVLDLYSTLLPNLLLRHMAMATTRRQKIAIYGLFGLGYITVAMTIVRTVFVYILFYIDYDFTWALRLTHCFLVLELDVGIIAGSGPALKALYGHVRKLGKSRAASGAKKSNGSSQATDEIDLTDASGDNTTYGDESKQKLSIIHEDEPEANKY